MSRLLLLAVLVAAAMPALAAGGSARRYCTTPGDTLAQGRVLRVFEGKRSGVYYVCHRRSGRRVAIGEEYASSSGSTDIGPAAVAGSVAAWQEYHGGGWTDIGCPKWNRLHVRDFGRRRRAVSVELRHNGDVKALVVKRNRSFAWIEERPVAEDGCGDARTWLVRRRDSRGNAVLAAGDTEARDLRLADSRITWSDGTGTHRASIR